MALDDDVKQGLRSACDGMDRRAVEGLATGIEIALAAVEAVVAALRETLQLIQDQ